MNGRHWCTFDWVNLAIVIIGSLLLVLWLLTPRPQATTAIPALPQSQGLAVTPAAGTEQQYLPAVGSAAPLRLSPAPPHAVEPQAEQQWGGSCAPNATVTLREGDQVLASTRCSAEGNLTLSFKVDLAPGEHQWVLEEGTTPAHRLTGTILVDPGLTAPTCHLVQQGGTWQLSGNAFPGTLVRIYGESGLLGKTVADPEGHWRWQPEGAENLAGKQIYAVGVSLLGQEGTPSPPITIRQ